MIAFAKGNPGGAVYIDTSATPGNPNTTAVDAIFTEMGQPLAFDLSGLDLGGLDLIVRDLDALRVGSDGNLTGPTP
jgi:hypothetical protein